MSGWVSVEDRLPDGHRTLRPGEFIVIAWLGDHLRLAVLSHKKGEFMAAHGEPRLVRQPTHWMPIPAGPTP